MLRIVFVTNIQIQSQQRCQPSQPCRCETTATASQRGTWQSLDQSLDQFEGMPTLGKIYPGQPWVMHLAHLLMPWPVHPLQRPSWKQGPTRGASSGTVEAQKHLMSIDLHTIATALTRPSQKFCTTLMVPLDASGYLPIFLTLGNFGPFHDLCLSFRSGIVSSAMQ